MVGISVRILFRYLKHLSIFFSTLLFYLFLNNFCIDPFPLFATKHLRDSNKNLEHLIGGEKHIKYIIDVHSHSRTFSMDLNGKHVFAPTLNIGVVHMWVVCT